MMKCNTTMGAMIMSLGVFALFIGFACVSANEEARRPQGQPTPRPEGPEWIDLLAGDSVQHWQNVTDRKTEIFSIEEGVFHVPGQKPTRYIAWMGEAFGDFTMHVEFKVGAGSNSGIFFRSDPKDPVQRGFEIQVFDDAGQEPSRHGSGSLYDVAVPMFNLSRPTGEWNSYDITCRGPRVEVVMNGWKVLDLDLSKMTEPIGKFDTPLAQLPRDGHIILQDHGGEVWFRNLVVKKRD